MKRSFSLLEVRSALRRRPLRHRVAMRLRIRRNRSRRYTRGPLSSVSAAYLCVLAMRSAAI